MPTLNGFNYTFFYFQVLKLMLFVLSFDFGINVRRCWSTWHGYQWCVRTVYSIVCKIVFLWSGILWKWCTTIVAKRLDDKQVSFCGSSTLAEHLFRPWRTYEYYMLECGISKVCIYIYYVWKWCQNVCLPALEFSSKKANRPMESTRVFRKCSLFCLRFAV